VPASTDRLRLGGSERQSRATSGMTYRIPSDEGQGDADHGEDEGDHSCS